MKIDVNVVKRNAKISPNMTVMAEDILNIIKNRNEETDAPLPNEMQAWDIAFSDGMPVMAVPAIIRGKKTIGYLTPFRGYRFQVSGDFEGHGDFGSTIVTKLRDYAMDEHQHIVLMSMAELCLYRAGYSDCEEHQRIGNKATKMLDTFVALCISYLKLLPENYLG